MRRMLLLLLGGRGLTTLKKRRGLRDADLFGVRCGARTHDTQTHNLVLYQLN